MVECLFALEAVAESHLHADRFLPPTPVRIVISHKLADVTEAFRADGWEARLQKGSPYKLLENADIARRILPAMIGAATKLADTRAAKLRQPALAEMNRRCIAGCATRRHPGRRNSIS
jgi:ATP-dependent helicase HepA